MSGNCSYSEDVNEASSRPILISSLLFKCNLFRLVPNEANEIISQCLVCKRNGQVRRIKGKTTSNLHLHMKRLHRVEYDEYIALKDRGDSRPIIPIEQVSDDQNFIEQDPVPRYPQTLFEHGFFEIVVRLPNRIIKANCLTCQRLGRANLIQAREYSSSNLLGHLKRLHPAEHERYLSLRASSLQEMDNQPMLTTECDLDIQQSVVSTIKNEHMEFVEVNHVELPNETWDSYESSELYDYLDNTQIHGESMATSTTRTAKRKHVNVASNPSNDEESNDGLNDFGDVKKKPPLFRGEFFKFIKSDGILLRAECMSCQQTYSGHLGCHSNFIKHLKRMHPSEFERYKKMKSGEKVNEDHIETKLDQSDFNRIVLDFMINGMHHPDLLHDSSFAKLLNDIALNRPSGSSIPNEFHVISPKVLMAEITERINFKKENFTFSLKSTSSISTAIDVWSVNEKTYLLVIINWVDPNHFQRISSVIACEIFTESISSDAITERIQQIYTEFEITDKIVATVTNNCPPYKNGLNVTFLPINGLKNHIQNATYLLELISSEGVQKALNSENYANQHNLAFGNFDALSDETKHSNLSEKSSTTLKEIFKPQTITSKATEIYNGVSNLAHCDRENLNELVTEIGIPAFTEEDMKFFKEYSTIVEPIATAIEYLQKNNCYFATLLPMAYSMKENLTELMGKGDIQLCQALLTEVLSGVEQYFEHFFDFNNEKCIPAIIATCTHPFFKMRWLKGDMKTPTNTNKILDLLVKVAKEHDETKNTTIYGIASECEQKPQEKKFKFSFDTSAEVDANDETMIQMDFMSFLKKPCQNDENNLEELKLHPWVQKLFVRYNSILSSTTALEQSVQISDLIRKSQLHQFDDDLYCKMGFLREKYNDFTT